MENKEKEKKIAKYSKEIQEYQNEDKIRAEVNEILKKRSLKNRVGRKDISDREIDTVVTIIQKILWVYNAFKIGVVAFWAVIKIFKAIFKNIWEKGKK